jgi:purine-binding chemotaxis protein CheW
VPGLDLSLAGQELTPLFGQPEWFLGILPSQAGNLKVLDTARWVMPDRYRDDFRQGLQYVISVQGYEWGWRCIRSAARCAWTRTKSNGAAIGANGHGWRAP